MIDPPALFDAAFMARAPMLGLRMEAPSDHSFLTQLFIACSPFRDTLPPAMLEQQASFQQGGYAASFPSAMRRLVTLDDRPIGRVMIDWGPSCSYLIDIAVMPAERRTRAGRQLLHTWLEVVDRLGQAARLDVRPDNPARAIYLKLGFEPVPDPSDWSPVETLCRPARK